MTMRTTLVTVAAVLALAAPAGAVSITGHNVTQGGPHAVAPAIDGSAVFVGARDCAYIGRFALALRTFSSTVPQNGGLGCAANAGVFSMVQGLDGKLYFTLFGDDKIGRVNPDGTQLETVDAEGMDPLDITLGPDGSIWFALNGDPGNGTGGKIGRVNPHNFLTSVETFAVPGNKQGPRGIIAGPDGNLYVPGGEADVLWRVTPTGTPPQIAEVDAFPDGSGPSFGEVGPDGRIWFTLFEGNAVRTYNPNGGGGQTIPLSSSPWDVAFGEDGKAYATLYNENRIAQIDRGVGSDSGVVTVTPHALPSGPVAQSVPVFIAASPSGNLFAAGRSASMLFEIVPDVPPRTVTGIASSVTSTSAAVAASVNPRASATSVRILYGPTQAFGHATPATSLEAGDNVVAVGFALGGLAPETTYYYRAEASNQYGTTVGPTRTFTTAQAPDADADGSRPPADCNDTNRLIKPGATEIINDGVDQDCSGADLRLVPAGISNQWKVKRGRTTPTTLAITGLKGAATIEVRCKGRGCPFKKKTRRVSRATRRVSVVSFFKRRSLRPKTVIEVRVRMTGFATKVVRYTTRSRKVPSVRRLCLAPGATRAVSCPGA